MSPTTPSPTGVAPGVPFDARALAHLALGQGGRCDREHGCSSAEDQVTAAIQAVHDSAYQAGLTAGTAAPTYRDGLRRAAEITRARADACDSMARLGNLDAAFARSEELHRLGDAIDREAREAEQVTPSAVVGAGRGETK